MKDWFATPTGWLALFSGITCVVVVGYYVLHPLIIRTLDNYAWKKGVDTSITNFEIFMSEIREKINEIFLRLPPPNTIASESPITLTTLGVEISKELSAKEWANAVVEQNIQKVQGKEEFEIYAFCKSYVEDEFQPDVELEVRIRKSAYEHGIEREKVLGVFTVELRDSFLKHLKSGPD